MAGQTMRSISYSGAWIARAMLRAFVRGLLRIVAKDLVYCVRNA